MQLNDCAKIFYEVKKENTDIEERLYTLENMVSGVDTVYELRNDVSVLRTKVEMFQPRLDSLEGRIDNVEDRISELETNLGYLISDVKKITSDIKPRIITLENSVSGIKILEDKVNNLNILIDDSIIEQDEK